MTGSLPLLYIYRVLKRPDRQNVIEQSEARKRLPSQTTVSASVPTSHAGGVTVTWLFFPLATHSLFLSCGAGQSIWRGGGLRQTRCQNAVVKTVADSHILQIISATQNRLFLCDFGKAFVTFNLPWQPAPF